MNELGDRLPPGQQLVAADKWPLVGERVPSPISADTPWALRLLEGDRSVRLTLDEITALGPEEFTVDIHCVTRWSRLDCRFCGVALSKIFDFFQPTSSSRFLRFVAKTERLHSTSLLMKDALDLGTFLATHFDGEPLSVEHGGPLRSVVPGRYLYKSLKWLTEIEFTADDQLGYWETEAGYHNVGDPWKEERFIAASVDKQLAARLLATRRLDGENLMGFAARGRDLAGLTAVDTILRNADFCAANLDGADFRRANLSGAKLRCASLQGATFEESDIEGADFCGADLRGANFAGASMFGATFVDRDSGDAAVLDRTTIIDQDAVESLCPLQQDFVREHAA